MWWPQLFLASLLHLLKGPFLLGVLLLAETGNLSCPWKLVLVAAKIYEIDPGGGGEGQTVTPRRLWSEGKLGTDRRDEAAGGDFLDSAGCSLLGLGAGGKAGGCSKQSALGLGLGSEEMKAEGAAD